MLLKRIKYVNKIKNVMKTMYEQTKYDNHAIDNSMERIDNFSECYSVVQCMLMDYFNNGLWKLIYLYLSKYNRNLFNKYTRILRSEWL